MNEIKVELGDIYIVKEEIVLTEFGDELALLNPTTGSYHVMNEVGKDILNILNPKKSVSDVINHLCDIYEITKEKCEIDVVKFIHKMLESKIITKLN